MGTHGTCTGFPLFYDPFIPGHTQKPEREENVKRIEKRIDIVEGEVQNIWHNWEE